eukprot:471782_1
MSGAGVTTSTTNDKTGHGVTASATNDKTGHGVTASATNDGKTGHNVTTNDAAMNDKTAHSVDLVNKAAGLTRQEHGHSQDAKGNSNNHQNAQQQNSGLKQPMQKGQH